MKSFYSVICLALFYCNVASASEAAAPSAQGVAPPEEAGASKPNSTQEVLELQARLQVLKTKIIAKREAIKKLINDKQATRDEKKVIQIINDLKAEHKELTTTVREYGEQRSLLNYRYPEKGLTENRKYERIEVKSLDEMESEFSIEGKVKRTVGRLRQQYPETSKQVQRVPASHTSTGAVEAATPAVTDPSRTSVTESQILSK